MIRHIVLLKIKADTAQETVDRIQRELAGLKAKIQGILSFDWGAYSSDEGLNKGFTHGFVMDFESAAARDAYLPHPEHEKVKALVLENINGLEDVIAFDFEV
jgi:hypothetical protein